MSYAQRLGVELGALGALGLLCLLDFRLWAFQAGLGVLFILSIDAVDLHAQAE